MRLTVSFVLFRRCRWISMHWSSVVADIQAFYWRILLCSRTFCLYIFSSPVSHNISIVWTSLSKLGWRIRQFREQIDLWWRSLTSSRTSGRGRCASHPLNPEQCHGDDLVYLHLGRCGHGRLDPVIHVSFPSIRTLPQQIVFFSYLWRYLMRRPCV